MSALLKLNSKKTNRKLISDILKKRKASQPINLPSAGCIFKNPKSDTAASLIEQCSLKGKIIGQAQISKKHANFIVNLGGAKFSDVLKLITLVKKEVKNKFKINLIEEIQII